MKKIWKIYDFSIFFAVFVVILSGVIFNSDVPAGLLLLSCAILFLLLKFIYYKKKHEKLLYQIDLVSRELTFEHGKAFEILSVPCVVVEENGNIIWLNESFKKHFEIDEKTNRSNLKQLIKRDSIEKLLNGYGFRVKVDSSYFSVYSSIVSVSDDEKVYLLYFFDETNLRQIEKEYYDSRPSVMQIVIDNADEVYQNYKESESASVFSGISRLIDNWASSYNALCRTVSNDKMFVLVEEKSLQKMIADKFDILEKVRSFSYEGKSCELTLSIGIGREDDLNLSNSSAKQALDMAQSRGGDQVAIKQDNQYRFFGGVSGGHEKKNKVRTRLIAKTIAQIINESDNVLVVGHRFSDFDSFGGCIGMYKIAEHFNKDVKIVINMKNTLARPLVEKFVELNDYDELVSPEKAISYVGENTLVIVVDTHKKDFTDCPELLSEAKKVMVIDHHRKSVDYIEDTVMFYHMPSSSSACEMIAELSQYVDTAPVIDKFTAFALFSGIMLDTRNFIIRAGVRTFEAAAYLRSKGANTVDTKKLFSNGMEIFRQRNTIIDNAEKYRECVISVADSDMKNIRLVTSQAADEMLNIEGVRASFVIYENGDYVNISARSYGEINVQLIMEALGGGGHQTMSACQLSGCSVIEAEEKLKNAINQIYE